jgi:hypothetical protein
MLDDLVGVIETLQQRIRDHGPTLRENETRTRMALIDPLLAALGWDVSDPAVVTPEYNVSGGRADYALRVKTDKPAAVIEAKRLGEPLGNHSSQMVGYALEDGVAYAGLTDGDHWQIYDVFKPVPLANKRILDVSIAETPAHECALQLLLLWRPNLASGQPVAARGPVFAVEAAPAPEPSPMQIVAEPIVPQPVSVVSPVNGWVALSSLVAETGDESPKAIRFLNSDEYPMQSWVQLVQHTVAWLSSEAFLTESNVPIASSNKRFIVHTEPTHPTGKRFNQRISITGTPFVIEGNVSCQAAVSRAKKLLETCGQDPARVFVRER